MTMIDALMLVLGFALVWGLGVAVIVAIASRNANEPAAGNLSWSLGCGWFVGAFVLTLWMRVLALIQVPFGIASIGLPLAAVTGLLAWRARTLSTFRWSDVLAPLAGRNLAGWRRVIWLIILGWLALRFALLLNEIVWRPLFPWDAWMQWGTKARVWFELRTMVPFVSGAEWLQATSPNVYFDAAPHYPATVPLMQVWAAILLGRWDDTLVNLPWWLTGFAFAFAIYGYLAREEFEPVMALLGTWLVMSLPILEVHIALAGYADLAMATYFTLAALWSLQWVRTRRWGDAAVALLLLIACAMIKNPGKVWVAILVPGIVIAMAPRRGIRIVVALFALAIGAMLLVARAEPTILGYHLHLDFEMPWRALFDAYFAYGNWNLLWYGALAVAVLARRHLLSREVAPYTAILAAGLTFLLFGFAFTNARLWVEDQSTVNRATLNLAPLIVVWSLLTFRAWARQLASRPEAIPAFPWQRTLADTSGDRETAD
jgi:hypothetical protein